MAANGVWAYTIDQANSAVQALNVGDTLTDTNPGWPGSNTVRSRQLQGINDEPSLAAAGLEFLFSLEDPPKERVDLSLDYDPPEEPVDKVDAWGSMHLANVSAPFCTSWTRARKLTGLAPAAANLVSNLLAC